MSAPRALLRLGWRDLWQHKLRSLLVMVLVMVGSAVLAMPLIMGGQVLTPGSDLDITGRSEGFENQYHVDPATLVGYLTAAALALVLGALLIAPAFLISARRRVRELGMIAATGAGPVGLASVVLVPAVLSGALGGGVGVIAAVTFYFAIMPASTPADVTGGLLGAGLALLFGILLAASAAAWPALLAARAGPVAAARGVPTSFEALQGGVSDRVPGRREAVVLAVGGLGLVAAGTLLAASGARAQGRCAFDMCEIYSESLLLDVGLLVVGVLLIVAGAVVLLAGLLAGLSRARLRSVVSSYVVRDAARHRTRVLPAVVASVMLIATAGAASAVHTTVVADHNAKYTLAAPLGSAVVSFGGQQDRAEDVAELTERLGRDAAVAVVVPVRSATVTQPEYYGGLSVGSQPVLSRLSALNQAGPLVGDERLLESLGRGSGAQDAWRDGRVLVADSEQVRDGQVLLAILGVPDSTITVAAEVVPELGQFTDVVLTKEVAGRLGLTVETRAAIVVGRDAFTEADEVRLGGSVAPAWLLVERGSPLQQDFGTLGGILAGAVVAVLLVIWVMSALAAQETRGDSAVLDALGAAPRTRRRIAGGQTALIVIPAAVLGVPAALGLALVFLAVEPQYESLAVQVPVGAVVSLLVGVPLIVLVGAWATGPRLVRQAAATRS